MLLCIARLTACARHFGEGAWSKSINGCLKKSSKDILLAGSRWSRLSSRSRQFSDMTTDDGIYQKENNHYYKHGLNLSVSRLFNIPTTLVHVPLSTIPTYLFAFYTCWSYIVYTVNCEYFMSKIFRAINFVLNHFRTNDPVLHYY